MAEGGSTPAALHLKVSAHAGGTEGGEGGVGGGGEGEVKRTDVTDFIL